MEYSARKLPTLSFLHSHAGHSVKRDQEQTVLDQGATSPETDSCGRAAFDTFRNDSSGGTGQPYGRERLVPGTDGVQSPAGVARRQYHP